LKSPAKSGKKQSDTDVRGADSARNWKKYCEEK